LQDVERSFDNSANLPTRQMSLPPLAFVDVETTGVDPRVNRITEVGVVTVDGGRVREWSTVINPLTRRQERPVGANEITDEMRSEAPRFKDIAAELARSLDGRLLIAHNVRFDHGFLKAEFDRAAAGGMRAHILAPASTQPGK
jgi:DNA polymerase-3 subunit epsilon